MKRRIPHPDSVPTLQPVPEIEEMPDTPFAEGARDELCPDLRYRLISESAFHLLERRGYADGYDLDDWFQAEAAVDHLLLVPDERRWRSARGD
jgi:hypothetical protein